MLGESQSKARKLVRGPDSHESLAYETETIEVGRFTIETDCLMAIAIEFVVYLTRWVE